MPKRRALTEAQLETPATLPADEAALIQHWGPQRSRCRRQRTASRSHSRPGFAVQLCTLRCHGRLLRPGKTIPPIAGHFVVEQVGVEPKTLVAYERSTLMTIPMAPISRRHATRVPRPGVGEHGRRLVNPYRLAQCQPSIVSPLTRSASSRDTWRTVWPKVHTWPSGSRAQ